MPEINGNGNGHANGTAINGHAHEHIAIPRRTTTPGARLRNLLADPDKIIVAPGVYDGFSARIALEVGFECLYMVSRIPPAITTSSLPSCLPFLAASLHRHRHRN